MKEEILEKIVNSKRGTIVSGISSTNKTKNVMFSLVNNAIDKKENLFILDSKEEYIKRFGKELKDNGYNTIIINLNDVNKSDCFNPLEYPYYLYKNGNKDKTMELLELSGKQLFAENANVDPFWTNSAAGLFEGIVLGLFEDAKSDEINLSSVTHMLDASSVKSGIYDTYFDEYFRTKDINDPARICASTTIGAPNDTKISIVSVAKEKLTPIICRDKFAYLLSNTTFKWEDLLNKQTAFFFIGERKYSNIFALLLSQLFEYLKQNNKHIKYNFILDNFDNIEYMHRFDEMLELSANNNIKIYIATRDKADLEERYGIYINKLVNHIETSDELITVNIDKYSDSFKNESNEDFENEITSIYPTLKSGNIKLFNYEGFINSNKKKSAIESLDIKKNNKEDIDKLIKEIDKKIAEIEKEESNLNKDN